MNTKCQQIIDQLPDYAVGKGSKFGRANIQKHLDSCPGCAKEFSALNETANLINQLSITHAPDMWDDIRPNLEPRTAHSAWRLSPWLHAHRAQSALAGAVATLVLGAVIFSSAHQPPTTTVDQMYMANHISMSWREPFADKAGMGLTAYMPVEATSEEIK